MAADGGYDTHERASKYMRTDEGASRAATQKRSRQSDLQLAMASLGGGAPMGNSAGPPPPMRPPQSMTWASPSASVGIGGGTSIAQLSAPSSVSFQRIDASRTSRPATTSTVVRAAGGSYTSGLGSFTLGLPARTSGFGVPGGITTNAGQTPSMPSSIAGRPATNAYDDASGHGSQEPNVMTYPVHCLDKTAAEGSGLGTSTFLSQVCLELEHLVWIKRDAAHQKFISAMIPGNEGWPVPTSVHLMTLGAMACEIINQTRAQPTNVSYKAQQLRTGRSVINYHDLNAILGAYHWYGMLQGVEKPFKQFERNRDNMATLLTFGRARMANVWADDVNSYMTGSHLWIVWMWAYAPMRTRIDGTQEGQRVYSWQPFAVVTTHKSRMSLEKTLNADRELGREQRMGMYFHIGQVMNVEEDARVETKEVMAQYIRPASLMTEEEQSRHIKFMNQLPRILVMVRVGEPMCIV